MRSYILVEPSDFTCEDPKLWPVWVLDSKTWHLTHGFRSYCGITAAIQIDAKLTPARRMRKSKMVCADCLDVAFARGEAKIRHRG